MARSFAPSLRPTLRPFLASGLARAQVTKRGATTLLGARLLAHVARQFDAGGDYHGFNRFQSSQRIGADASLTIRYRPRHRAMCSADKSKRAREVFAPPPGPLNARQNELYDEPPEVYRPNRAQGAPLAAPAGLHCLCQTCSERRHQADPLGTAAPTGREQSLRLDRAQNRTRLSKRAHPLPSMVKGVTRAL